MIKISQVFLISFILIARTASSENIHFHINGLPEALKKNIYAKLSSIQNNETKIDENFFSRTEEKICQYLKILGYYEPKINFNLCSLPVKKDKLIIIHINHGEPVRIGKTNVIFRGGAHIDQDYLTLLKKRPAIGTILNHNEYENFKKTLTFIALRKGYFDSHFNKSQLSILLSKHQAFWDIDYDSGQRYRFGNVSFEGASIYNEYLQNLIPFKNGDFFESKKLAELNHRLSATGWFNSIIVTPEFDKSTKDKVLPLHVVISPCAKNTIEMGIGYSTNVGFHVKTLWKKLRMNSYSDRITTSSNISIPEQQINFNYKIPLVKNSLEHYFLMKGEFKHTSLKNFKENYTNFTFSRYWDLFSGWKKSINLCYSFNYSNQNHTINSITSLYSGIVVNRTRSYSGLMPSWGDSHRYAIYCSSTVLGSDVNFMITQAQNIWIRTLYNQHRFIIRSNFNWIETNDFDKASPILLFLSGYNQNIRGYKYKPITFKNNNTKFRLINISKIITGSLEYQYNIFRKWWGSMFIDIQEMIGNIYHDNLKIGVGTGIRWESPIGLAKIDFALPINNKKKHNMQFYINFGPELL